MKNNAFNFSSKQVLPITYTLNKTSLAAAAFEG